jgi:hypothetical protein
LDLPPLKSLLEEGAVCVLQAREGISQTLGSAPDDGLIKSFGKWELVLLKEHVGALEHRLYLDLKEISVIISYGEIDPSIIYFRPKDPEAGARELHGDEVLGV